MTADQQSLEALAAELGEQLQAQAWQVCTAESCTGGWVAQVMTAIAGSSAWFERGFVTYSNTAKQEMLGVPEATLAEHGAVSEATVLAMAKGALNNSKADLSVAISGIAGPGGGSAEKPVGTVWFAWATAQQCCAESHLLSGDRQAVRQQAVMIALRGLQKML